MAQETPTGNGRKVHNSMRDPVPFLPSNGESAQPVRWRWRG